VATPEPKTKVWINGWRESFVSIEREDGFQLCSRYIVLTCHRHKVSAVVTAKAQYNPANAREYFEEHLCVGDYYDEGERVRVSLWNPRRSGSRGMGDVSAEHIS